MSMICVKCDVGMSECQCPDADERLRSVAYDPAGFVAFKWCRKCDKHYVRCKCEVPKFYIIRAGKDWTKPSYETAAGTNVVPDLNKR